MCVGLHCPPAGADTRTSFQHTNHHRRSLLHSPPPRPCHHAMASMGTSHSPVGAACLHPVPHPVHPGALRKPVCQRGHAQYMALLEAVLWRPRVLHCGHYHCTGGQAGAETRLTCVLYRGRRTVPLSQLHLTPTPSWNSNHPRFLLLLRSVPSLSSCGLTTNATAHPRHPPSA